MAQHYTTEMRPRIAAVNSPLKHLSRRFHLALLKTYEIRFMCVRLFVRETKRRGGLGEEKIDALSACGADAVCLGDIQPSVQFLRVLSKFWQFYSY